MKQKFIISGKDDGKRLVITEYAEIDKDVFSVLCEETYDVETLQAAAKEGIHELAGAFRTRHFFPPVSAAMKIAEGLQDFMASEEKSPAEILIDETESLEHYEEPLDIIDDLETEEDQLDDLLDDTVDVYDEEIGIKKINSSIQMDEDELLDDNGDV